MKKSLLLVCLEAVLLVVFPASFSGTCAAQKLAITLDDLPQNGGLPPGVTRVEITKSTLAVLKKRHVPPVYGFINSKKLEGSADGAEALKLWAAAEPVGNHTYTHMDLEQNPPEAFERDIEQDEVDRRDVVEDEVEHALRSSRGLRRASRGRGRTAPAAAPAARG